MNIKLYVVGISKPVVTSTDYAVQFRLLDADYVTPSGLQTSMPSYMSSGVIAEFTRTYTVSGVEEWKNLVGQVSDEVEFTF